MARARKEQLRPLTVEEQQALTQVATAPAARVDRMRRATALLAVTHGQTYRAAAQEAGVRSASTVANLVQRFNAHGLAALRIGPGRGRPSTYGTAARAVIVATAQRSPNRERDGTASWSLSTLTRSLRREGLPGVGARRPSGACCRMPGSSYQKTRTWCPTGTAQRKRKSGTVSVTDPLTEEKRGASTWPIG